MTRIKKLFTTHWLQLLAVIALALPLASNANCGSTNKKLTFADGSIACLEEFSFLNKQGLMKSIANESYATKSQKHISFAIAVTAQPMFCPFEQSMQWGNLDSGSRWNVNSIEAREAVRSCENKMNAAIQVFGKTGDIQSCKCEVLVESGTVKMSRAEFELKTKTYERQIALGLKPIQVSEAQLKEQADREEEAKRQAEAKKREDDRLIAMKERAEREAKEEAERKKNAPPTVFAMRRALLIGNDTYKYADVLKNAREDARAMANELKGFGYEVTLRLDQSQKEMQATLRDFRESIKEGDEVLFYFSGHAVEIDGKNYLTPIDTIGMNQNQLADDSIDLKSSVLDPFTRKKAKLTLALIDACRNNPFLKTSSTRSVVGGSKGLAPTTPATGQLIVYSAGSGQTALDRLGESDTLKNGLFTRVFLQEMKKVDLPIDRVIKNVRTEVVRLARTIGHDQVPAIYDEVVGDFYFKK
jgi:hypothetical protein